MEIFQSTATIFSRLSKMDVFRPRYLRPRARFQRLRCHHQTKKLDGMGEYTLPDDYKAAIQVIVNPDEKTLKFIDNGIGMTADEVEEYITQIAFSGATEFLEKYKDKRIQIR